MEKNLTIGKPLNVIISFGIPLLLGNIFQQLYNMIDAAIVGKTLGGFALAAVGATGSINFLVLGFCIGICNGFAIPLAREFGAKNNERLRSGFINGVILCIVFAFIITISMVLLCFKILISINTPSDILDRAYNYIIVIFCGIPSYFIYNFSAGVLRSVGDSKTPVKWLIIGSILNIILDLLFIITFKLDVFGAALATVIAQFVSGIGCCIHIYKNFPVFKIKIKDLKCDFSIMKYLCIAGLPMGLQTSITAIGTVMIQSAVNSLGTDYVTVVTAANKILIFLYCPFDTMGTTMATYSSQNLGASRLDRLNKGLKSCIFIGAIYSALAFIVIFGFADNLNSLFLDNNSMHLLPIARQYSMINASFLFPLALVNIIRFMVQGLGFSPLATVAGIFEMIARGFVSYLTVIYGFLATCFASPFAWILADLFLIPAYIYCYRNLKSIFHEKQMKT